MDDSKKQATKTSAEKWFSDGLRSTGVSELLMEPGKRPNSSGTRNLQDNLSDLKAQVAANNKARKRKSL